MHDRHHKGTNIKHNVIATRQSLHVVWIIDEIHEIIEFNGNNFTTRHVPRNVMV